MSANNNITPPTGTILVVDDDDGFLHMCEQLLRHAGYKVVSARDGASAMRILTRDPVDLLLCDIFMPEKDGFEVIQGVRRRYPELSIVAMSGGGYVSSGADVLELARRFGARATLTKPFTGTDLLRVVEEALGSR